jgi:cysteinyl-tRNA synthetase
MRKSKGTFLTLGYIKEKGFSANDLRIIYLLSHYRSQMNFTWKSLEQAQKNHQTINTFYNRIQSFDPIDTTNNSKIDIDVFRNKFEKAMDDDLNTPLALSTLFAFITKANTLMDNNALHNITEATQFFKKSCTTLGINLNTHTKNIPPNVTTLAQNRKIAKDAKNYELSDQLRNQIEALGYKIKDVNNGFELNKL